MLRETFFCFLFPEPFPKVLQTDRKTQIDGINVYSIKKMWLHKQIIKIRLCLLKSFKNCVFVYNNTWYCKGISIIKLITRENRLYFTCN